jgi:AraC family transcriptional regulator
MPETSYTSELSSGDLWEGVDFAVGRYFKEKRFSERHPGHRIGVNLNAPHYASIKQGERWKRYRYDTGAMGLVPYGDVNEFCADKDIVCVSISLHLSWLERFLDGKTISLLGNRGVYDRTVHLLAADLQKELLDPHFVGRIYAESLIHTLALHLVASFADGKNKVALPKGKLTPIQSKKVIDYCHASLGDNPGLSDLAGEANLSPFHFARLFKQTFGYSPCQYLHQLKLEAARKLIRAGRSSLTEIAYELGFSDQAHFCKAFRRATGMPPGRF